MSVWADDVKRWPLAEVAAALGLQQAGPGHTPCPACGADRRSQHDGRGPVGHTADGGGWRCHRCQAGGDALTLAAIALTGEPDPPGEGWARVRAWAAARGWCAAGDGAPASPQVRLPAPLRPSVPPAPRRPPAEEVATVWGAAAPVTEDTEVSGWLRGRGLDPAAVDDLGLARALRSSRLPRWAHGPGGPWTESGHRLLLPLFDAHGRMASLRARAVVSVEGRLKGLAPSGCQVAGLVLACPLGRRLLAGDARAAELVRDVGLVVAEGEPDTLTWATRWGVDAGLERAPAVVGLTAGSWTDELAARVPDGTRVGLRVHHDDAGDKYAALVVATLKGRCEVRRPAERAAA